MEPLFFQNEGEHHPACAGTFSLVAGHSQLSLAFSNSHGPLSRCICESAALRPPMRNIFGLETVAGVCAEQARWVNVLVKQAHFFNRHDEGVPEVINLRAETNSKTGTQTTAQS